MCTFFTFTNDLGHRFSARAMEWPAELDGRISFVPRGHKTEKYTAKYGFVGAEYEGDLFADVVNEHGLQVAANEMNESIYAEPSEDGMHIADVAANLVTNCRNVEEAIDYLKAQSVYTGPLEMFGPDYILTLHLAITDRSGRSVVVEWLEGELCIFENEVGAMSNDPSYPMQLKLLAQFNPAEFDDETFYGFDRGCSGRFLHAASLNARQPSVPTDLAGVNRAFAILNTLDIVPGMLYWREISDDPQVSSVSSVMDFHNMHYYFRTYDNYDIRKIDINKIDFGNIEYQTEVVFGRANYQEFAFSDKIKVSQAS